MSEIDRQLDAAWRAASREQPSAALDASIRAAARRAVAAGPGEPKPASWWRVKTHWAPLAAAAAVAIIAVGIIQLTPPEQVTPGFIADRPVSTRMAEMDSRKPSAAASTSAETAQRDATLAADELARNRDADNARKQLAQAPVPMQAASNVAPEAVPEKKRGATALADSMPKEERQIAAAPDNSLAAKLKAQGAGASAPVARGEPFPAAQAPAESVQPSIATPAVAPIPRSEPFPAAESPRMAATAPAPAAPPAAGPVRGAAPEVTGKLDAPRDKGPAQAGLAKVATTDQARAKDVAAPRPADEWIKLIRRLRAEGKSEEAAKELAAFRAAYKERTDELLPADLREAKP